MADSGGLILSKAQKSAATVCHPAAGNVGQSTLAVENQKSEQCVVGHRGAMPGADFWAFDSMRPPAWPLCGRLSTSIKLAAAFILIATVAFSTRATSTFDDIKAAFYPS